MILFEIVEDERHSVYQELEVSNGQRQYDFLNSIVVASLKMGRPFLSQQVIKAFNFHAICCLHTNAGEYRPCRVVVGCHEPPPPHRVQALMDDFVNQVNRSWNEVDEVSLAAYVLWRINYIHPFINGNGRTARAACYFVLCLKAGGLLPGDRTLPELLKQNRDEYVKCLIHADDAFTSGGAPDLGPLHALISSLIEEQLKSAGINQNGDPDAEVLPQ